MTCHKNVVNFKTIIDDKSTSNLFNPTPLCYVFVFQVSLDGNVATTTVIFIPEVKDQDKILYCRAKNLHISTKTVEDQWKIKVACKCVQLMV